MEILFLVGRILFGGYFIMSGLNHFMKRGMLSGYAASKGVPWPALAVPLTGLLILGGGLGVILGVYVRWAVFLLAVFLIPVSFKMHNYWAVEDPNMKMVDQVNFLKNMALLGGAFMLLAISEPWPFSLFL